MAHVPFSSGNYPRGAEKYQKVKQLRQLLDYFQNDLAVMVQMLAGQNGSSDSHFADHVAQYGYDGADDAAKLANAHLSFNEQGSWLANVAALEQFLAIHG